MQKIILMLILLWIIPGIARAQDVADRYVYFIKASQCGHGTNTRALTGFRVQGLAGIVTALHGVADSNTITVASVHGQNPLNPVHIIAVDIAHDVALLSSSEIQAFGTQGFKIPTTIALNTLANQTVKVIGYPAPLDLHNLTTSLTVRTPAVLPLYDLMGAVGRTMLQQRKSPAQQTLVLSLQGEIVPGHSGAPVLDSDGRVVAIANGGLNGGTTGITWAIPYSEVQWQPLSRPLVAKRLAELTIMNSENLFSYDGQPDRTLEELKKAIRSALSPEILQQIAQTYERSNVSMEVSAYDQASESNHDESIFDINPLTLSYKTDEHPGSLSIKPVMGYLKALESGGPVSDLSYYYCPFQWAFPELDIKVVNNSHRTVFFNSAILEVKKSTVDPWPVLIIPSDDSGMNALHFFLSNEGWGSLSNCKIDYDITPFDNSINESVIERLGHSNNVESYKYHTNIGQFSDNFNVDISQSIRSEGIQIDALQKLHYDESITSGKPETDVYIFPNGEKINGVQYAKRRKSALGKFSNNAAIISGIIHYSGQTVNGSSKTQTVHFHTVVYIMNEMRVGAPMPPSFRYNVMLDIDRKDYTVRVPISQSVKPGESDRFLVRLGAPKSSDHSFLVKLTYNDGQTVSSLPITMNLFLPRSASNMIRQGVPIADVKPVSRTQQ